MTTLVGQTVSHYRILEFLGGGGMDIVYKAHDLTLQRPACIMLFLCGFVVHESGLASIVRDGSTITTLNHETVCTADNIQVRNGGLSIMFDFVGRALHVAGSHNRNALPVQPSDRDFNIPGYCVRERY